MSKTLFEIDNLDCINDAGELNKLSVILGDYARYAAHKAQAVEARLAGRINDAITQEQVCDNIYHRMPDQFRKW